MKNNKKPDDPFLISFADIAFLFRKNKKIILNCAFALCLLGITFALLKPIRYRAEGTFREKDIKKNDLSATTSVIQVLSGNQGSGIESEAASLMISRRILNEVIDNLHLQAHLSGKSNRDNPFKTLKHNLFLAWSTLFKGSSHPFILDSRCPLKIDAVAYHSEYPSALVIDVEESGDFTVKRDGKPIGTGRLGESFAKEEFDFVLNSSQPVICKESFRLTLSPLHQVIRDLRNNLKVESTKWDKTLLKISSDHRDRHLATKIVNETMASYQRFLKNYQGEIAKNQLEYLNQRRNQLASKLNFSMQKHADCLSDDISNSGFIEASKEIDFLARSQHEYKQKRLDNELEIIRLTNIKPNSLAYYHRYSTNEGDPAYINNILSEMRTLKQQRDALEIELEKKARGQLAYLQASFEQQLDELKEVQQNIKELRHVMAAYQAGKQPENSKIMEDPRFLLMLWVKRVNQETERESFKEYLDNLARSFEVHEKILLERLTHRQNPTGEYKGITLEVATNLYLDYSKQHVQTEGAIRQNRFFIEQIEKPDFEITSLSSDLGDEISNHMIRKASDLVLNLRDQNNQSLREQERIKEELKLQRTFLNLHLNQMVHLMELKKELIDEKIFALENISLELVHQRISLLEHHLQDYLKSRLNNLHQEKTLIQRHLENIHGEMALLPQKWVSEQLLRQEVETNQKIVEEIAKLVESKNISHNLEVIQSAPIDLAVPPPYPLTTSFFLYGFLGLFLGGFLGSGYVLGKALRNGMPATIRNLGQSDLHVSGDLQDNGTLRRLQTFLDSTKKEPKRALLLENNGPHYTVDLADLYQKRGKKVLILDLNGDDPYKITSPSLLHYLEGKIDHMPIRTRKGNDWLNIGSLESIHHPSFLKVIDELQAKYDWLLAFSSTPPFSSEAESLLPFFPYVALSLGEETIEQARKFSCSEEQKNDCLITFLFYSPM